MIETNAYAAWIKKAHKMNGLINMKLRRTKIRFRICHIQISSDATRRLQTVTCTRRGEPIIDGQANDATEVFVVCSTRTDEANWSAETVLPLGL